MHSVFIQIGIIFVTASIIGTIFYKLKQQMIIAYLLSGVLLGDLVLGIIPHTRMIEGISSFGIILLLYLIGLDLNIKKFKKTGLLAVFIGISQTLLIGSIVFGISKILYFSTLESLYISLALTFSSTVVVVKILSEKKSLNTLYGQISIGILIFQDIIAIFALLFFSSLHTHGLDNLLISIPLTLLKGITFCISAFYISKIIIQKLFKYIAHSQELLFLSGLTWCFILAIFAEHLGFSREIGAFIAGISLASSPFSLSIIGKTVTLRNVFITIFFVGLGSQLTFDYSQKVVISFIIFSMIVLILKPIIISVLTNIAGFQKRTGFLVGISLGQISEFSLILVTLGLSMGHIDKSVFSLITAIGITTMILSSFLCDQNKAIFRFSQPLFNFFDNPFHFNRNEDTQTEKLTQHIIIAGCDHFGQDILEQILEFSSNYIVVEENPDIIDHLKRHNINCVYGDILDESVLEKINFYESKIFISTIPYYKDNLMILQDLKIAKQKPITFMVAQTPIEGLELKNAGADYILLANYISGKHIGEIIKHLFSKKIKKINNKKYIHYSSDKWDSEKQIIRFILESNKNKLEEIRNIK